MPLLNYQPWKAELVKSGKSKQTIRKLRKKHFKVGDKLYHYVGSRTKNCKKLGESVCSEVIPIKIFSEFDVFVDGLPVSDMDLIKIAKRDGFQSRLRFLDFFLLNYGFPFEGQIVRWEDFKHDK